MLIGRINSLQEILCQTVSSSDDLESLSPTELEALAGDLRRQVQSRPTGDGAPTTDGE